MPLRPVPTVRMMSPPSGSTLTTSAPWSASTIVASGPDMFEVRSTTLIPARGRNSLMSGAVSQLGAGQQLGRGHQLAPVRAPETGSDRPVEHALHRDADGGRRPELVAR